MLKCFFHIEDEWNVKEAVSSCKMDNIIHSPMSSDLMNEGIFEFQKHWRNGDNSNDTLEIKAIDCLSGCELEINTRKFFEGYKEGRKHIN
ncbi:transcription factor jumonji (jmjC) domain-containing protein [Trifolium repens]|nr:transcription factor jumonji (jmjC) domain-containing protein [Trifolium repens]